MAVPHPGPERAGGPGAVAVAGVRLAVPGRPDLLDERSGQRGGRRVQPALLVHPADLPVLPPEPGRPHTDGGQLLVRGQRARPVPQRPDQHADPGQYDGRALPRGERPGRARPVRDRSGQRRAQRRVLGRHHGQRHPVHLRPQQASGLGQRGRDHELGTDRAGLRDRFRAALLQHDLRGLLLLAGVPLDARLGHGPPWRRHGVLLHRRHRLLRAGPGHYRPRDIGLHA